MKRLFVGLLTVFFVAFSIILTFSLGDGTSEYSNENVHSDLVESEGSEQDKIPVFDLEVSSSADINNETNLKENKMKNDKNHSVSKAEDNSNQNENKNVEKPEYTVDFFDSDGQLIESQIVKYGMSAVAPEPPKKAGYRFIGWDVCFTNVTSNLLVTAQYKNDDTSLLYLNDVSVKPGDKNVKMVLSVKNNPGILGMILTLTYDEKVMKLNNAVVGKDVDGILDFTKSKVLNSGCSFVWDGVEISPEQIKDGELLVLDFEILKGAPKGEYDIAITYTDGDIIDNNLEPLYLITKSGKINVGK